MRIHNLLLKNIGPFKNANLEFIGPNDNIEKPPVIILTGDNGTGKTLIIDAIRSLFYGVFEPIERDITSSKDFLIQSEISFLGLPKFRLFTSAKTNDGCFNTNNIEFSKIFRFHLNSTYKRDFILNYWTSKLSSGGYNIKNIEAPEITDFLHNALSGLHENVEVTKCITFFDYLSDSKDEQERRIGQKIFQLIKEIVELSILDGKLSHISRTQLLPIILIQNKKLTLDKLSSGNIYLIQRFIFILKQMYSVCMLNNISIEDIQKIGGLLLIDEAENHLHPKWQKVFLNNILKIFPNLQIIVTTHSPFIVSSVSNSRIYVCSSDHEQSFVKEETDLYSNKPVEEILLSPLFSTQSFNNDISELLIKRKKAIELNENDKKIEIEKQLLKINPEYFNYLNIDELIKKIKG